MRLTTKCRYGTRAMIEIANAHGKGSIRLSDIAQRQGISAKYLVHLLSALKTAGLVKTARGARGGYWMDRAPSEIKLREVFQALEGSAAPVECVDDTRVCPKSDYCAARAVWVRIRDAINEVLDSTTLQDLLDQQREKEEAQRGMYHI